MPKPAELIELLRSKTAEDLHHVVLNEVRGGGLVEVVNEASPPATCGDALGTGAPSAGHRRRSDRMTE